MKYIMVVCSLVLSNVCFAQSQSDYENAVSRFQRFYNAMQIDSLINQYSDQWGDTKYKMWTTKVYNEIMDEYGKMNSYKYVASQDDAVLFKVSFDKSTHMMGILLDSTNKMLNFRLQTSSPTIDSLFQLN